MATVTTKPDPTRDYTATAGANEERHFLEGVHSRESEFRFLLSVMLEFFHGFSINNEDV